MTSVGCLTDMTEQQRQRLSNWDAGEPTRRARRAKPLGSPTMVARRQLQRGGPYTPSTPASDSRVRHKLLRSGIHTDRGLPRTSVHRRAAVGEPVGLIVVGGQFHQ